MLGVLCARPRPWILNSLNHLHALSAAHQNRLSSTPLQFADPNPHRHHSRACQLVGVCGGAASIWHVVQPSSCRIRSKVRRPAEPRGEGSWNVAWDARPARWLYRPDSAWLLFGVCACLSPVDFWIDSSSEIAADVEKFEEVCGIKSCDGNSDDNSADYKVTGVVADGRCLFRAIVHGACLTSGEEAPDETRQRELADDLRALVVDELLKRRKEVEWFIEGDFDAYVTRIRQPYVWGGEPELLMASHVLKTIISVFMIDRSGRLVNIANYGEESQTRKANTINVLFHGYGHYDLLESLSAHG